MWLVLSHISFQQSNSNYDPILEGWQCALDAMHESASVRPRTSVYFEYAATGGKSTPHMDASTTRLRCFAGTVDLAK